MGRRRYRQTTVQREWKDWIVEAIIAGMAAQWNGQDVTHVNSSLARLSGAEEAKGQGYGDSRWFDLGQKVAKLTTICAQNNVLLPQNEHELGRLILQEEATALDTVQSFGEDAYNGANEMSGGSLDALYELFT